MPLKDRTARLAYHSQYMRDYLSKPKNRRRHRARVQARKARQAVFIRELIAAFRASGCQNCPEKEPCCLTAHHLDPEKKDFNLGNAVHHGFSIAKVERELAKCLCLCMNCHTKVHAGKVHIAGWSSPVARQAHNLKAVCSNHTPATEEIVTLEEQEKQMVEALTAAGKDPACSTASVDLIAKKLGIDPNMVHDLAAASPERMRRILER